LVEQGKISRDEEVVCCVTGSGFKSSEIFLSNMSGIVEIEPDPSSLKEAIVRLGGVYANG
jgi:threonine synthase